MEVMQWKWCNGSDAMEVMQGSKEQGSDDIRRAAHVTSYTMHFQSLPPIIHTEY
jgi:hypothetical protein